MNSPLFLRKIASSKRGIALISVLVIVVLLTAVILGFLVTSKQEQVSSRSYKASSSARQMADTAVNLVQGQINEATSQGITHAWASQPGAIRVYDDAGALSNIYKLYSAENLTSPGINGAATMNTSTTVAGASEDLTHPDMPPITWYNDPAVWVDLNSPANDAGGKPRFPIFDESQAASVDGLSVTGAPGVSSGDIQQAPMPVRWLYVLQNGQIIAPDTGSTGQVVTFNNSSVKPTPATPTAAANPIVGRIAFWTDDETCKVNINTAGGDGVLNPTDTTDPANPYNTTFWDAPHFVAPDDVNLASKQPAQGEFQRYPGHPAAVALNNVLHGLGWNLTSQNFAGVAPYTAQPGLLPRYSYGGSQDATLAIDQIGQAGGTAIPLKPAPNNHLYTSVAEMLFSAGSMTTSNPPQRPGAVSFNNDDSATQARVETARFFLTAHSRAPEVTLFGQPRVSIWPQMVTAKELAAGDPLGRVRSAIDNLLAFCATVPVLSTGAGNGDGEYYFTRYDPTSCTNDIGISRNDVLLNYLDYFTSLPVPGYGGGNFDSKYKQLGMRQILTEIFDYIRTINIADCTFANPATLTNTGTYAQPWIAGTRWGLYQVAPSVTSNSLGWGTQGYGIYPRLNEVAIQFIEMSQGASAATNASSGVETSASVPPSGSVGASPGTPGTAAIPMNPVYGATKGASPYTSSIQGDSSVVPSPPNKNDGAGAGSIFGLGDLGSDPNNPTASAASINYVSQDKVQYLPSPPASQPNKILNPNYLKWVAPGNLSSGSQQTMAVQAFILLSFVNPSAMQISNGTQPNNDDGAVNPTLWMEISGLQQFTATGSPIGGGHALGFPSDNYMLYEGDQSNQIAGSWTNFPFWNPFAYRIRFTTQTTPAVIAAAPPNTDGWNSIYPYYSKIIPIQIDAKSPGLYFGGGTITVSLYDGGGLGCKTFQSNPTPPVHLSGNGTPQLVQTYKITFPPGNFPLPTFSPSLPPPLPSSSLNYYEPQPYLLYPPNTATFPTPASGPSVGIIIAPPYNYPDDPASPLMDRWNTFPGGDPGYGAGFGNYPLWSIINVGDVVQSMILGDSNNSLSPWTDVRMLAMSAVPDAAFTKHPLWGTQPFAYDFRNSNTPYYTNPNDAKPSPYKLPTFGKLNPDATYYTDTEVTHVNGYGSIPEVPSSLAAGIPKVDTGVQNTDWDNGIGLFPDGPWVNKADEGTFNSAGDPITFVPYFFFQNGYQGAVGTAYYSPNREIPSPGMLGSLPTGVDPTGLGKPVPWQTLLFRPIPTNLHPGAQTPRDHLLLDLFWMPVAEPYALSEPFSTAGKINLNYQIQPFTYITRSTALRAILNTEKIAVLSSIGTANGQPNGILYKQFPGQGSGTPIPAFAPNYPGGFTGSTRFPLDVNMTLTQFDDKFNGTNTSEVNSNTTPDIFHSASQICEMYLVPKVTPAEPSVKQFAADWYGDAYGLVGDNTRERPYTNIYGQITTKSNSYTVYYTVQSLKNAYKDATGKKDETKWDENQGAVLGEYRGSTTLERYVDTSQTLPDFATTTNWGKYTVDGDSTSNPILPSYYKWRVVDNHPFAP